MSKRSPPPLSNIKEFLIPREETERIVWIDRLQLESNHWQLKTRVELSDGSLERRNGTLQDICWPKRHKYVLGPVAFEPPAGALRRWQRFENLPIRLNLANLPDCEFGPDIAKSLLALDDLDSNTFLQAESNGFPLLVPRLSLLSAIAFPAPQIANFIISPGFLGLRRDDALSTTDELVVTRTYSVPIVLTRIRAYECLGFWLEHPDRKQALHQTFASLLDGAPAVIPHIDAELQFRADGYTDGKSLVVQVLSGIHGFPVWPRRWTRLLIRDQKGVDRIACRSNSPEQALFPRVHKFPEPADRASRERDGCKRGLPFSRLRA